MAEMKISNLLVNDTKEAIIAWARQLKDDVINWLDSSKAYNSTYKDKQGNIKPCIPQSYKDDPRSKFQDKLNELFLTHYADFQMFLNDKGVPGVIDTWRDVEEFLENISDDDATTLMSIINALEVHSGNLNIRMSNSIPGLVEAVTQTAEPIVTNSHIDDQTGAIVMIYNFN